MQGKRRDSGRVGCVRVRFGEGKIARLAKTDDAWQRFQRIVLVHAVRQAKELSFQDTIAKFTARGKQFCYVPFVSREDTNFAIKGRVPNAIENGALEAEAGIAITADKSQVMLCGNPDMVSDTRATLEARGLKLNKRKEPGQISVENYW